MSATFGFFGALLIGLSQQFGIGAGWDGVMLFKTKRWKWCNAIGWILLCLSYPLMYLN